MADDYNVRITSLIAGGAVTIDARSASAVIVRADTGATVTASAVDALSANAHTTGTQNSVTVAALAIGNLFTTLGPWPFYRISSASGTARVAVMS